MDRPNLQWWVCQFRKIPGPKGVGLFVAWGVSLLKNTHPYICTLCTNMKWEMRQHGSLEAPFLQPLSNEMFDSESNYQQVRPLHAGLFHTSNCRMNYTKPRNLQDVGNTTNIYKHLHHVQIHRMSVIHGNTNTCTRHRQKISME